MQTCSEITKTTHSTTIYGSQTYMYDLKLTIYVSQTYILSSQIDLKRTETWMHAYIFGAQAYINDP